MIRTHFFISTDNQIKMHSQIIYRFFVGQSITGRFVLWATAIASVSLSVCFFDCLFLWLSVSLTVCFFVCLFELKVKFFNIWIVIRLVALLWCSISWAAKNRSLKTLVKTKQKVLSFKNKLNLCDEVKTWNENR